MKKERRSRGKKAEYSLTYFPKTVERRDILVALKVLQNCTCERH
jgi:hypothetical protein